MISVVIATCGSSEWEQLAWTRAYPAARLAADRVPHPLEPQIVVEHLTDGTIAQARNYAATKAIEPWLVFLDADDELDEAYLLHMQRRILMDVDDPFRLYAPAVMTLWPGGRMEPPKLPNQHMTMPPLNHCVIGTAVASAVFDGVGGFREGYYPWEDYELWLRCMRRGCVVTPVPECVYVAHAHEGSAHRKLTRRDAHQLATRIHREHRQGL